MLYIQSKDCKNIILHSAVNHSTLRQPLKHITGKNCFNLNVLISAG